MKTLGLLIVFLSIVSYGFVISRSTKNEAVQSKELLRLMIHIKDQIKHFNKPLGDIYTSFESENSAINTFLHNLCITDWDNALENTENLQTSSKCKSIIREFGKKLGKNDYTSQIEMCDYYINIFEKEVELLCSLSPQKTKISISLAFYAGLLLLIIMW